MQVSGNEAELFRAYEARQGNRRDLDLRDQEHTLFARDMIERLGPVLGRLVLGVAAPGYSGAKVMAQNYGVDPFGLAQSTPPDFRELWAGLRPVFEGLGPAQAEAGMGVR